MTVRTMEYKGFKGTIEFSEEDGCFFGKVLGIGGNLVAYEGDTEEELRKDFEKSVESISDGSFEQGKNTFQDHGL